MVLLGRLALYGAGAARLHEEVIPVTAIWTERQNFSRSSRADEIEMICDHRPGGLRPQLNAHLKRTVETAE